MIRQASQGETVINNTFNIYAQPGPDIQELGEQIMEYITESIKRRQLGLA